MYFTVEKICTFKITGLKEVMNAPRFYETKLSLFCVCFFTFND